jgi:hypothetical protein
MAEVGIVTRKPRLPGVFFRAVLITAVLTLLTFAVSLLFAIIGMSLYGTMAGHHPDMANAYRYVALPVALAAAAVALVGALVFEVKRYRQRLAAWRGF